MFITGMTMCPREKKLGSVDSNDNNQRKVKNKYDTVTSFN